MICDYCGNHAGDGSDLVFFGGDKVFGSNGLDLFRYVVHENDSRDMKWICPKCLDNLRKVIAKFYANKGAV